MWTECIVFWQAVVESVRTSPTLERLNLSANAAGEGTASAVVALLRLNQTITELDLSCNQYGQEACTSIRKALEQNTSVRVGRAGAAGPHAAYLDTHPGVPKDWTAWMEV